MLIGDPAYKFIHVEDYGYVTSYAPRTSFGDFQTMLSVSGSIAFHVRTKNRIAQTDARAYVYCRIKVRFFHSKLISR